MWSSIARFSLRSRRAIIFSFLILTIIMGYFAAQVKITYEFAKLLPDNDSAYIDYQNFKGRFGEDGAVMVIGLQDKDLFKLDKFNDWYDLGMDIKKIDGIQEVVSIARVYQLQINDSLGKFDFLPVIKDKPKSQAELDSLKEVIFNLKFYDGFILNKDSSATVMAVTFDKSKLNTKNRLAMVDTIKLKAEAFEKKHHLQLHYSGLPYIRTVIARKIAGEMGMFLGLAFLITAVILLIFFRSTTPVVVSVLVVIIGVIFSFGTIVLFGYKITVLSGLIPPLIIVIGVPNCILLLNKYHVEYGKFGNQARALTRMVEKIGVSTFFANVTTSIGFAVFCFTNSKILVEFGLVAAINVMATYVTSLLLIPAIFSYLAPPSIKQTKHIENKIITKILTTIDFWVHTYRKRIYTTVSIAVFISLIGISQIKTIGYVVDDLPKRDAIYTDMHFFERTFHGVLPFEIDIDTKKPNGALALPTIYKINKLQKIFKGYDEFSKPISSVEALKFANQAYHYGEKKFYTIPSAPEMAEIAGVIKNSNQKKQATFKSFVDSTKQHTRVSIQMADVGSVRIKELIKEIRPQVDSIFDPSEYHVTLTGNSVMFLKGNDYLIKNLQESVIFAVILIALVMFSLFASLRMVIISILPSIVPLLFTAGIMGFFGIPLKASTILVFSIAFGIASDGNMYFLTKYKQEFKLHHYSISKTVSKTIKETGVSMIYTAIILFCGFGIFTFSSFGGTAALGVLISLTLLVSYCSNLILLPSFLLSLEHRMETKAILREPLFELLDEDDDIELEELKLKQGDNQL
jgi:predicted RND superfamily exporter protein